MLLDLGFGVGRGGVEEGRRIKLPLKKGFKPTTAQSRVQFLHYPAMDIASYNLELKNGVDWNLIQTSSNDNKTPPTRYLTIIIIHPLLARVVGAPQMISQHVFSIFPCSSLPSGTWRTPGLSIPRCCLPASSSVCLVFFLLSLCLAR